MMKGLKIMYKSIGYALVALIAVAMAGCDDNDSFSASAGNVLTFSTDTVRIDTLFSTVPSTTRSFWVYNNSGDGIRCSSVSLENGDKSGFRVNVDGTYLSPASSYTATDVEIRKGDSIRVFVELTSSTNGAETPQLLEDNLVFQLESGVTQKVNLTAYTWDALKLTNAVITSDTTFSTARPILVYGGITVAEGATLTLAAGTTLYFHDGAGIDVYGRLCTEGQAGNEVVLRGDRLDNMFDYLPYDLMSGLWNGLTFHASSYDNTLAFTDIHSTFDGVVCDSADATRPKLTMRHCTIHNCQGYGLRATNSLLVLENCQLTNAMQGSVCINGGDVTMNFCTLAQYYPFDSNRGPALAYYATSDSPLLRMDFVNGIVTGFADDQVFGGADNDSTAFNYRFVSSILRTPEVSDSARIVNVIFEDVSDTAAIQGTKHFQLVSHDTQHYDFHLSAQSTAIDRASTDYATATDRDGTTRDATPDIGCYERVKE